MTEHRYYKCPPDCDLPHCPYCMGGLAYCIVCRAGEAELPSECPGRPMTNGERHGVMDGAIDYKEGVWYDRT